MSAKRTLADLQTAFKPSESEFRQNDNFFPFWLMDVGEQAVVRFLPDENENNPLGFLVVKLSHSFTVDGKKHTVPCLYQYEKTSCPICKISSEHYSTGDKVEGKKYYRSKQYVAQAIIVSDPLDPFLDKDTNEKRTRKGYVCQLSIGYNIYKIIEDVFKTAELDDIPYLYKGGTDFIIKKEINGDHPTYTLSNFSRKSRDLTDDEIAVADNSIVDLTTFLPKKPPLALLEGLLSHVSDGTPFNKADFYNNSKTDDASTTSVTSSVTSSDTGSDTGSATSVTGSDSSPDGPVKPSSEGESSDEIKSQAESLINKIRNKHRS